MNAPDSPLATLSPDSRRELESLLLQFDKEWSPQKLGTEAQKLPAGRVLRLATLVEMIKIDVARHWQRGNKVLLDSYLQTYPELGTPAALPADLVYAEFQARRKHNPKLDLTEYSKRFPRQFRQLQQWAGSCAVESASQAARGTNPAQRPPSTTVEQPATPVAGDLPEQFGRYRILKKLGQGGMGAVYLADDSELGRQVALKVPRIAADEGSEGLQRFLREAKAAATIDHPNICRVYDVGQIDGVRYVTMAYVDGKPLSQLIKDSKGLPQRPAAAVVRKLALALAEAHRHGVIHRDLKPSNVMINAKKEPVVMDFGLARVKNKEDVQLTKSGALLGTPAYMSPEQVRGDVAAMGPGCDIYSLGVILYEMVTGRIPFQGSVAEVMSRILTEEPEQPSTHRPDLEPGLEEICLKAMAKRVEDRYATMADFAEALTQFLKTEAAPGKALARAPKQAGKPVAGARAAKATAGAAAGGEGLATELLGKLVDRLEAADARASVHTPPRTRWWVPLFAAVVILLLIGGVIFVVTSGKLFNVNVENKNTVVVTLQNIPQVNDITVVFILDSKPVDREALKNPIPLAVGTHKLQMQRDGKVFETREFTVTMNDHNKPLPVPPADTAPERNVAQDTSPAKPETPAAPPAATEGWVQLFNGKDLSGWTIWPVGTTGWEVKDGVLTSSGPVSYLFSPNGWHRNFRIRFEARINEGGVGGMFFRSTFVPGSPYGYLGVVNSTANHSYGKTGSVYQAGGSSWHLGLRVDKNQVPADTWFTGEIIADGNRVQYLVNGQNMVDSVDDKKSYTEGFFSLYRLNRETTIQFRKVELQELPPPRPVVQPGKEAGWVQLFNHQDLKGWKAFPSGTAGWEVKDGLLVGSGPVNGLFTERGDYQNFHFRVEARINDHGDAAQMFRSEFGPGTPNGYALYINSTGDGDKMGTLYRIGGSSYHPGGATRVREAPIKPDTWFVQEIIADGNHLVVKLNGETITDVVHQQDFYTKGHLALHKWKPNTVVAFRHVEIKELPPTK